MHALHAEYNNTPPLRMSKFYFILTWDNFHKINEIEKNLARELTNAYYGSNKSQLMVPLWFWRQETIWQGESGRRVLTYMCVILSDLLLRGFTMRSSINRPLVRMKVFHTMPYRVKMVIFNLTSSWLIMIKQTFTKSKHVSTQMRDDKLLVKESCLIPPTG